MQSEGNEVDQNNPCPWESSNLNNDGQEKKDLPSSFVDKKILRMMEMMGYQLGYGLGKNEQGITLPVTIEPQLGKQGFGLKVKKLHCTKDEWDFTLDNVNSVETIEWLHNSNYYQITTENIDAWLVEDSPKINIEEEDNFCDKDILHGVLNAKSIFDHFELKALCQARARANPFETIRSVFFMNRASLKMANIDAATDFMFTEIDHNPFHRNNMEPYYFADVCAGPGGFTEYILWRKKWLFKGFGFTLRGDNDFKLTNSICASPATFLPMYGVHKDGNVCCPENIKDFKEKVLFETEQKGVHFMMSDGGFSVEGNENIQEILSKNIYICQCLVALEILRKHGHFVTKVFDVFTCFSVGLLYLMYSCFDKVSILKPNSSRPANSERYIICCDYKGLEGSQRIITYLTKIVERLWELRDNANLDITEIVPLSVMQNDHNFYSYILNSNNRIAKSQTLNLQKLAAFCRNPVLVDHRQELLRTSCLQYWQIPDKPKAPHSKFNVENLLSETVNNREFLLVQPREACTSEQLEKMIDDVRDWRYTLMQCRKNTNICNFYAGVALSKVYRLQYNKWVKVKNLHLTCGTLLYGELVKEKYHSNNKLNSDTEMKYKYCLHVIDALQLGDINLSDMKFQERNRLIAIYCKALNHEFKTNTIRIRPKMINTLESLPVHLNQTYDEACENYISPLPVMGHNVKNEFYEINSVLLLKTGENQSFNSTYVLRMQLFINETEEPNKEKNPFQTLLNFVNSKKT